VTANSLSFRAREGGVEFAVIVSAGSSRPGVRGVHGSALKVAVSAAPERGKANAELEEAVAGFLMMPVRAVSVVSGRTSRRKRMLVKGLSGERLQQAVGGLAGRNGGVV